MLCIYRDARLGCYVTWWDNFSKIYGTRSPTLASGAWRDCLWTGIAVKKMRQLADDEVETCMDLLRTLAPAPTLIPAMPDDLLAEELVEANMATFKAIGEEAVSYYHQRACLVKRHKINNIPLKAVIKESADPVLYAKLKNLPSVDGVSEFFPSEIKTHNIGSNEGLLRLMRELYEEKKMGGNNDEGPQRYEVLNVDMNIFNRCLKVTICHVLIVDVV
jgi:hypothetical protein